MSNHMSGKVWNEITDLLTTFLQQQGIVKMNQPANSLYWNPIEHIWEELELTIGQMENTRWVWVICNRLC